MSEQAKKRIQIALALAIVVAGARAAYILYQRHEDYVAAQKQQAAKNAGYSNAEYYVTPKKLYPFDLKSAKQLTDQPVWVKEGYRYTYYPYDAARKKVDFSPEAGLLLPIERLEIKDVVTDIPSGAGNRRQVMAVFQKDGKSYAVPSDSRVTASTKFIRMRCFMCRIRTSCTNSGRPMCGRRLNITK